MRKHVNIESVSDILTVTPRQQQTEGMINCILQKPFLPACIWYMPTIIYFMLSIAMRD